MSNDLFVRSRINAALDSARHIANGAIGVREMTDPGAAQAMQAIQRIYECEFVRLLEGKVSTKEKQACTNRPRLPAPFCGDWSQCNDRNECEECAHHQLWLEEIKAGVIEEKIVEREEAAAEE